MKSYFIILALFCALFVTAQEDKPKRNIFGSQRVGFYVGVGTGYNTKINPNQYNWAKGLYLTQYSTIGFTYKKYFGIEYSHCFLYRTVKNVAKIKAGDSSYTVTYTNYNPPDTYYTSKFTAYNANAKGIYSLGVFNFYVSLFRLKNWGVSYSFGLGHVNKLIKLEIEGKDTNGNTIQYKPTNPRTRAFLDLSIPPFFVVSHPGLSFDYYPNTKLNIRLNFILSGFGFDNTYSLGRTMYAQKGDDSGFLNFWKHSTQFNVHISYYFLTVKKINNL